MAFQEKQLAQVRENSTNAVSVYSPSSGTTVIVKVVICNTSGAAATARLFHDGDGTTYDESTALAWDVPIDPTLPLILDGPFNMNNTSGNFAYRSSVANALTITLYGAEIT